MKGFVHLDHGGCVSSSSSLSPLAPPFKLDTSFPRPVSHSFGNIPEPHVLEPYFGENPHYVFAARPPLDNWLQMNSPDFVPNLFPNSNPSHSLSLGTDPVLPVCTAPASASQFTTNFFSSESLGRPYHPQHSSSSVQCENAPFTADKHDDMLSESGFAPTAPAGGLWKHNNGVELWESHFSPNYAGKVNQGKPYAGSRYTKLSAGKLSSESDGSSEGVQISTSRSTSNSASHQERPCQSAPSSNLSMETWSQLNPAIASYGSHFTVFDPYKPDPLCFYPASSNLYETPSTIGSYTGPINKTTTSNLNPIEPPKNACNRKETFENQSSSSTSYIPVNAERSDDRINMNGLVEKNNGPCMDPSMSINVNSPRWAPQSIDSMNSAQVTDTSVTAETREDTAFHCSSEELEQFNHGVDSPCWKGALESRYSLFGAAEGGGNSFNIQGTQLLPVNSALDFSSSELQSNGKHFGENGPVSSVKQFAPVVSPSGDICPSILGGSNDSQPSNKNVIHCRAPGNIDGGSDLKPSQAKKFSFQKGNTDTNRHNCESRIADFGIGSKDAANFGTTQVPYHVSERYSSLLARDNVPIDCSPTKSVAESFDADTFNGCKLMGGNVQTMLNLMQNLSESLLSYCSEDELKELDHVVIQQIIHNLSRIGKMSSRPNAHSPLPETTNCSGKPINAHTGTVVARYEGTNTKVQDVQSQRCTQNGCQKKIISSISINEVDSPRLAFPCNDLDEKGDSTKRIRAILEENFHEEESDMHLYKSLWLEAEAELCSQKYKERFARMKFEMEKYKKSLTNEVSDVDKPPSAKVRFEGNINPMAESRSEVSVGTEIPKVPVQNHNQLNSSHTEDDASVMARFHILKSRMNTIPLSEERQPQDSINGNSHLGTEMTLSNPSSGDAEDIVMKQLKTVVEKRTPKDWPEHQDLMKFGAMQSAISNARLEGSSAGRSDIPSEWAHVLTEVVWTCSA